MVAEFLRQEYASTERYGEDIARCLTRLGVPPDVLAHPDLTDGAENAARRRVLGCYRGYGQPGQSYLTDFPSSEVQWCWASVDREEVLTTLFTRYWAGIWEGSRSPRELASRIREGNIPAWAERDGILPKLRALAEAISGGQRLPPLILVSADDGQTRVVMEGHTRLTACALAEPALPPEMPVLMGISPDIARWDEY